MNALTMRGTNLRHRVSLVETDQDCVNVRYKRTWISAIPSQVPETTARAKAAEAGWEER